MNRPREITFRGRTQTLTQWAIEIGLTVPALAYRLRRHTLSEALEQPKGGLYTRRYPRTLKGHLRYRRRVEMAARVLDQEAERLGDSPSHPSR